MKNTFAYFALKQQNNQPQAILHLNMNLAKAIWLKEGLPEKIHTEVIKRFVEKIQWIILH